MKTKKITPAQLNVIRCDTHYKWLFWARKKRLSVNIDLLKHKILFIVIQQGKPDQEFEVLGEAVRYYNSI